MNVIKERRKELKMTQQELAEAVGVTQATIAQWEKGNRVPRSNKWLQLSEALKMDAAEILQQFMGLEATC